MILEQQDAAGISLTNNVVSPPQPQDSAFINWNEQNNINKRVSIHSSFLTNI
jgi:hypothetical protein